MRGFSNDMIIALKEANHIENMLVFPFYNTYQAVIEANHYVIQKLNERDKGIKGLYWLTENTRQEKIDEIFKKGFVGLKYHGVFNDKPISDPVFNNALMWLDIHRGILLVHCGMFNEGEMSSNTSFHHALIVANKYRNIKVILGHAGGSIQPEIKKACTYAKDVNNVWLETSGVTSPVTIDYIANTVGVRKILFGSDAPWCSFQSQLYNVLDSNLPESKKNLILYENMLDLLEK